MRTTTQRGRIRRLSGAPTRRRTRRGLGTVATLVALVAAVGCGDGGSVAPSTASSNPDSSAPASSIPASSIPASGAPATIAPATDAPATPSSGPTGEGARQLELAGATPDQIACFEQRLETATSEAAAGGAFEPLSVALECLPKEVLIAGERLDLERTGASAEAITCVVDELSARSAAAVRQLVTGVADAALREQCGLPG